MHLQAESRVTNTLAELTPKSGENSKKLMEEKSVNAIASMKSFKIGRKSPNSLTRTRWSLPCSSPTSLALTRITTKAENSTVPERSTSLFRTYCHHRRQDGTSDSSTEKEETKIFSHFTSSWNARGKLLRAQQFSTQNRFQKRTCRKINNRTPVRMAKMTGHLREG